VVVVLLELDEFGVEAVVVVFVFVVSLVFSVVAGGFTTVVLCSVFFSGAGDAGATTSVFCSHAPKSAALAKMQNNFFIVWIECPTLGTLVNRIEVSLRSCRDVTFAGSRAPNPKLKC
jgi:Na+(H+)/acetate symporter ActP